MELVRLQERLADFESRGIRIVAASMDDVARARAAREKWGLTFDVVADPEGVSVDRLGIRHAAGRAQGDAAIPTLVAVSGDGRVLWTYQARMTQERLEPDEILARPW